MRNEKLKMLKRIRRLFCRHVFRKRKVANAFRVVDGWLVPVYVFHCIKCGKKVYETEREK